MAEWASEAYTSESETLEFSKALIMLLIFLQTTKQPQIGRRRLVLSSESTLEVKPLLTVII